MNKRTTLYNDREFIPTIGQGPDEFIESLPTYLNCCKCTSRGDGYRLHHYQACEPGVKGACTYGCSIWVHAKCGLPSFSFSRECQVCDQLYMPAVFPDYDWLCEECGGSSFDKEA